MASIFEKQARDINALKKQNKAMLEQASLQNQQMQNLQNQLVQASAVQEETLRNQIKQSNEIFQQKLYKDLLFLVENNIETIQSISNPIIKYSIILEYFDNFKKNCEFAMDSLAEIGDKQVAKQILSQLDTIQKSMQSQKENYEKSVFAQYNKEKLDHENAELQKPTIKIEKPIQPEIKVKSPIKNILSNISIAIGVISIVLGLILVINGQEFGFFILFVLCGIPLGLGLNYKQKLKKNAADQIKYNEDLKAYQTNQAEWLSYNDKLQNHPYHKVEQHISSKFQDYTRYKDAIDKSIIKFNEKWNLNKN